MISVNNVYKTVQAILNKEQRGFLSPQKFNYFAGLTNRNVFEDYFSDLEHFGLNPKGSSMIEGYANAKMNLREKIDMFSEKASLTGTSNVFDLPTDFYRLTSVSHNDGTTEREVTQNTHMKADYIAGSSVKAESIFPKYLRTGGKIELIPATITSGVNLRYVREPIDPVWGYVGERRPLYNAATSTNFELHVADFDRVVYEILLLAGVETREVEIIQFAATALQKEAGEDKQ